MQVAWAWSLHRGHETVIEPSPLDSQKKWEAKAYADQAPFPEGVAITPNASMRRGETLKVTLSPGGGYLMRVRSCSQF